MSIIDIPLTTLAVALDGEALTIWLDRPAVRNAANMAMCEELCALFEQLRWEPSVRVVFLRARGPAFCAGVDLREIEDRPLDWISRRRHRGLDAYLAIERCPAPVLCAIEGPAIGAGCELAAASDFVFSTADAFFQWPEALRGGVGACQRLPRIVGRSMARELLFTATRISAGEAQRIGFVNQVHADTAALEGALARTAEQIVACSAASVRLIKQAMTNGESCDRPTAIEIERQAIDHNLSLHRPGRLADRTEAR